MKHPVYFYCMLAVCCVFVGSKFLTHAGKEDSYYPKIRTPKEEYAADIEQATKASEASEKNRLAQQQRREEQENADTAAAIQASMATEPSTPKPVDVAPAISPKAPESVQQYEYFENPPKRQDIPSASTPQASTPAYPQASAQQYPTSPAQPTPTATATPAQPQQYEPFVNLPEPRDLQTAAQAATPAQPYSWQYYWQMVVTKATALQNYLAKQLAALRTRFGL